MRYFTATVIYSKTMEKKDFYSQETICQQRFNYSGTCFHVYSKEDHPLIFHSKEEFEVAMNIVAFSAFLFLQIRIFTFEILNNHFHFAVSGQKNDIDSFIKTFVAKLSTHPALYVSWNDIRTLSFKSIEIDTLDNLRNVISYDNRNGAVISPDENVFTYRWGANRYFFNREAKQRYEECARKATCREKRKMFCSAQHDTVDAIMLLDGYISPLCYCHIDEAESFFRNSRHYFHSVSRNIESSRYIAKSIGESLFYTDDDLFSHIRMVCSQKFGGQTTSSLPSEAKINLAKELHFDYNASNKQICRLLKMDMNVVNTLFPGNAINTVSRP